MSNSNTPLQNTRDSQVCPDWLLEVLRCPITLSPLVPATRAKLDQLNSRHALKPLCTRGGRTISAVPTQGLLSSDQCWLYPVQNQIPTLIPDEAIAIG
ncbi:MAG: hypothetical protein SGI77_14595 [Pirellulaceae bacterium]|nr:hypothetical protein [Pirellulaceae bacterium]